MIQLGQFNNLEIVKSVDFGLYLDGGDGLEILLPTRYVPTTWEVGAFLWVFVYKDNEGRLIATTETPKAQVGNFACLQVASVTPIGAFLHWGIMKDVLVPHREQVQPLEVGEQVVVYLYLDQVTDRVVASARLERFVDNAYPPYTEGQEVDLLVAQITQLGYKMIVGNKFMGLLFENEVFQNLEVGQALKGYIKQVRPDGKIDISLNLVGYKNKIDALSESVLAKLQQAGGFLPFTDKSEADAIYSQFTMSKKNFKKALGDLYKQRLIRLEPDGIRIVAED